MKTGKNNSEKTPAIKSLKDLQDEISKLKSGLLQQEQELEERWKQIPGESLKATTRGALPFALKKVASSETFQKLKKVTGLTFTRSKLKNEKEKNNSGISKVASGMFKLLKKKKPE